MTCWSFTEHPAAVGETYWQHMRNAAGFGGSMLAGGLACFIHALLPFLFLRTGSATIERLYHHMVMGRAQRPGMTEAAALEQSRAA